MEPGQIHYTLLETGSHMTHVLRPQRSSRLKEPGLMEVLDGIDRWWSIITVMYYLDRWLLTWASGLLDVILMVLGSREFLETYLDMMSVLENAAWLPQGIHVHIMIR